MKNRKMHKRVIENALRYYRTENLSSEKKEFLKKRIATLVGIQIRIYLSFKPSKKIKKELLDFYYEIKATDPELLDLMEGKIFKALRIGNCRFYTIIAKLYSRKQHVLG